MKKLVLLSAIAMSGLIYQNANAQIGIHFNINLGPRPVVVAQTPVYDDYYYLPDVEAYYSVGEQCYYYQDGGRWVSAAYLPGAYRDYDWKRANHYAVKEARPYLHNDVYVSRYGGFEGRKDWNYRDEHTRVYADRQRVDHDQYNRVSPYSRDDRRNDDRNRFDNRNDHQQQAAPQNNNRGNGGYDHQQPSQPQNNGRGNNNDHQQPSQPQNNGRGNNNNDHQQGQNNDRSNDNNNNKGGHDNSGGRPSRVMI